MMFARRRPFLGVGVALAGVVLVAGLAMLANPGRPAATPTATGSATLPVPTEVPGAPTATPAGSDSAAATALPLPVVAGQAPAGAPIACAGVGLASILHGDPTDPQVAWLVPNRGGERQDVVWPAGSMAVFDPALRVVGAAGTEIAREGDFIDGACVVDQAGTIEIPNDQRRFALDCGPMQVDLCTAGNATFQVSEALDARFPGRDPLTVRFLTANGAYTVQFADGGAFQGRITGF